MTAFEPLVLALAIRGAVLALRDDRPRPAVLRDAARGGRGETHARAALTRTVELTIGVRFQIDRARNGLCRPHDVRPDRVGTD